MKDLTNDCYLNNDWKNLRKRVMDGVKCDKMDKVDLRFLNELP